MVSIKVADWIVDRRTRVMYLVINWDVKELGKWIRVKPDASFNEVVTKFLRTYVENGEMPPEDIAPAIINLADDYLAGRDIQVRAGDYIQIQNHIRTHQSGR